MPEPTYPDDYKQCDVCGALLGKACLDKTGFKAVEGIEVFEMAERPHSTRPLRAEAARTGGDRG